MLQNYVEVRDIEGVIDGLWNRSRESMRVVIDTHLFFSSIFGRNPLAIIDKWI